ncbi:MAG: hypothetical protein KBS96_01470 [Lachnospiraceae bacterium]|nr:hypothetical protein [Candidatus Colinaster scatohippi]
MSSFEKKFGKYAISNITLYLIICYAFGYAIRFVNPDFINVMSLDPERILHGQVWRLFTWLVIPPGLSNIFFVLIMLYFYYSIGNTLEQVWGTYRLNVYMFSGLLFTIVGSFILYGIFTGVGVIWSPQFALMFSTTYINMSLFLAYAATFPDMHVLLFFIIPIKVKVLGIIYVVLMVYEILMSLRMNLLVGIADWIVIGSSLLNFFVFFITSRKKIRRTPIMIKRKVEYNREVKKAERNVITKHKCAVCDRTDESNPELEFRFCSKCNGNYEYCNDHLFTHTHVKY